MTARSTFETSDAAALVGLAEAALPRWDLGGAPTARLVNLSENVTCRIDGAGTGASYALRVHRPGYHDRAAIESELAWAQALRADGVAVTPVPVPGRDGGVLQEFDHPVTGAPLHAVLFAWEAGVEPSIDDDLAPALETLGAIAARMHVHARRWRRPSGFTRPTWDVAGCLGDTAPLWGRWRDGVAVDAPAAALFARTVATISRRLDAYGRGADRFGLVHADLRLANLLVDGPAVKVIDFDDCGFGWFLYDAATPLSFHEHDPRADELIDAWVRGYRTAAPLARADEAEIPTFVMLRRLLLVAWIGSHRETDLARATGAAYTAGTAALCESYLSRMG